MSTADKIERLRALREEARQGGGARRLEQQHARGKLSARERLDLLLDEDTFTELDAFVTHRASDFGLEDELYLGDGVVTGYGKVDGRLVFVYSQDFTVFGGSLSEAHAEKICKVMDLALENGAPIIGLSDSGGARIRRAVASLGATPTIFCATRWRPGGAADLLVMGRAPAVRVFDGDHRLRRHVDGTVTCSSPDERREDVTHEEIDFEGLGGARIHNETSRRAQFSAGEPQALDSRDG